MSAEAMPGGDLFVCWQCGHWVDVRDLLLDIPEGNVCSVCLDEEVVGRHRPEIHRRRLCAHADLDGAGMHWLEPGEICRVEALADEDR